MHKRFNTRSLSAGQRGIAIVAVVWMVAALSLIIVGIVQSVRREIQVAGIERQSLIASALGDAAILLALQASQQTPIAQALPDNFPRTLRITYSDHDYDVRIIPLNGHIDINKASVGLLEDLYRIACGMPQSQALILAQATVETRQIKDLAGVPQGFAAAEDLLRVPGMTYDLYARLTDLITADIKDGNGKVNPKLAPAGVLRVLANGDEPRLLALIAKRSADGNDMDTSFLKPQHIDMSFSKTQRMEVDVELPSGGAVRRAWDIQVSMDNRTSLPWRVLGVRQQLRISAQPES